jgi:hypothetical protein
MLWRTLAAPLCTPQPSIGLSLRLACAVKNSRLYQAVSVGATRAGLAVGALLPCRRFVLFASARSGSTLLTLVLDAHRSVECAGEVLNPRYLVYGDMTETSSARLALHAQAVLPAAGPATRGVKVLTEQLAIVG